VPRAVLVAPCSTGRTSHRRIRCAGVLTSCACTTCNTVCRGPRCTDGTCCGGHRAVLPSCTHVTTRRCHRGQHIRHRTRWTHCTCHSRAGTVLARRACRAAHRASLAQRVGGRTRLAQQAAELPSVRLILTSGARCADSICVDVMSSHARRTGGAFVQARCARRAARAPSAVLILAAATCRTRHCRAETHLAHRTGSAGGRPRASQCVRRRPSRTCDAGRH
jgi:hypothetical protein